MNHASRKATGRVWRITWQGGDAAHEVPPVYLLPPTVGIDLLRSFVQLLWNGAALPMELQLAAIRRGQPPYETEFLFDEQGPLVRCGDEPRIEARLVSESALEPALPAETAALPPVDSDLLLG